MNKHATIFIIISLLLLSITTVSSTKIQVYDTWIYEDNAKIKYDETALEIVQLISGAESPIAAVNTDTTRPFGFDVNIYGVTGFETTIKLMYDGIYLTQEGAISFIPVNSRLDGQVYVELETNTFTGNYTFDMKDMIINWSWSGGSPATSFLTTNSVQYQIKAEITWTDLPGSIRHFNYVISRDYLISSNSNIDDTIKNFTITETNTKYVFNWIDLVTTNPLSLDNVNAVLLTYETGVNQPIYIAQTEPVKTSELSLSQTYQIVEYFLLRQSSEEIIHDTTTIITTVPTFITITEDKTSFHGIIFFVSMFVMVPILSKYRY